ncbi:restriction endonuclease subunit S [Nitrosomonas sp.]|uniref:restriction endonuclease subunit S n=1 Tax=Nitrosomonas sp. TaxID=42353 RepID=UPI0032EC1634
MRGPQYLKWRDEQARGANIQNLRFSELAKLTIRLPERLEQRRIAARLKAQLAEVETTRQAVQAQWTEFQLLKSKAFQSLFDNIADWRPIGSVARLQSGYAFKSETFKPSGIRLLRNANILPGKVYWDNSVHISEEDAQKFPSYELATGDVLISLDRPIISSGIKVARVSETDLPALLLQRVGRFLLDKSRCDADYLYAYLQTDRFITEISGHDQSLGVPHISPTQVEAVEIPLPDLPTQRRIAKRLVEITDTWTMATKALQRQLEDLTVLPQHLLAQAFEN